MDRVLFRSLRKSKQQKEAAVIDKINSLNNDSTILIRSNNHIKTTKEEIEGGEEGNFSSYSSLQPLDSTNHTMDGFSSSSESQSNETIPRLQNRSLVTNNATPTTLPDSFQFWCHSLHSLVTSQEMNQVVSSSCNMVVVASGTMVKIMFLPVTLPIRVVSTTTNVVVDTVQSAIFQPSGGESTSQNPIDGFVSSIVPTVLNTANCITNTIVGTFVAPVLSPFMNNENDNNNNNDNQNTNRSITTSSGESSAENESFLDRLRIDIPMPKLHRDDEQEEQQQECKVIETSSVKVATSSDTSKYLLRVDDLRISITTNNIQQKHQQPQQSSLSSSSPSPSSSSIPTTPLLYIDLAPDFADSNLTNEALERLVNCGLDIVASNKDVSSVFDTPSRNDDNSHNSFTIDWDPEGNTSKVLKKEQTMTQDDWYCQLTNEVLVWSGKFQQGPNTSPSPSSTFQHYGIDFPLFLARGLVKQSPKEFLNLMWDSSRTSEYNNYSLARDDILVIQDNILPSSSTNDNGGSYDNTTNKNNNKQVTQQQQSSSSSSCIFGAKVVKSETKVPYTGMSVVLSVLMHAKSLQPYDNDNNNNNNGYIIISRSLDSGMSGTHVHNTNHVEKSGCKNEILLGVNILRPVPNHPEWTDLVSVSQVASTLVPAFLAKRIGMMGVEDFFTNVRSLSK